MSSLSKALVSSLLLVILTGLPYFKVQFQADLRKILDGLVYQESRHFVTRGTKRVAVGFGSCWDIVTDGIRVLSESNTYPPQSPKHFDIISSQSDLAEVFAYFFQNGAAAERFSNNSDFFDHLVSVASRIKDSYWAIGGNAPLMSQRLAIEGWDVLLAAKMTPLTARGIHPSISLSVDVLYDTKEDVHLVMEYDSGAKWGQYVSPRANRFILHNDHSNMMLDSLEGFGTSLLKFKPDLVVIGGLQMLDNFCFDLKIRTEKLRVLRDLLVSLPRSIKVHFEMASFTDKLLLEELLEYVIPYADSLGMNEQELANLHSLLYQGNISLVSDYSPRVAIALDQGRGIRKALNSQRNESRNHRSLTRLHVHTLAYQAIFTDEDSGWKRTRSATAKASLMATRHVCSSNEVNVDTAKLIMDESFSVSARVGSVKMPLMEDDPVSCWYERKTKICVAPNLVCTSINKTAGAGDNISAAGLSIQL